jgi:hypothetical protein
VHYTFRGRAHYAEFGDSAAVVLPLEGERKIKYEKKKVARRLSPTFATVSSFCFWAFNRSVADCNTFTAAYRTPRQINLMERTPGVASITGDSDIAWSR